MARLSYNDMRDAVRAKIEAAGGTISHAALVEDIDRSIARQLTAMVGNGDIHANLVTQTEGKPELRYSLTADVPTPTAPSGGNV